MQLWHRRDVYLILILLRHIWSITLLIFVKYKRILKHYIFSNKNLKEKLNDF